MARAARRIALTGGLGSGKSTVAGLFEALGAGIVDNDAISRELTGAGGAAIPALRSAFGDEAIDAQGALDRAAMRARAFADPAERQRLEAILHPLIRDRSQALAQDLAPRHPVLLFDIPLLAEGGARRPVPGFERVLVVDCPASLQLARARARSGLAPAQLRAVIAAQAGRRERLAIADDVLFNGGTLEELRPRVARLWRAWTGGGAPAGL
jgi:dephospho-CoA kinase